MKILFTVVILAVSYTGISQTSNIDFQLDTIRDYRIKIDGGCGIYNFQDLKSDSVDNQNCFVISQFKMGFFAIKNQHDYIYVKLIKKEYLKNGFYREIFRGKGFTIILTTTNGSCTDRKYRQGILEVSNTKKKTRIKVSGRVDYKI